MTHEVSDENAEGKVGPCWIRKELSKQEEPVWKDQGTKM